ncbi:hypothetical protein [Nitrospira moscoviensis]|uniref:DUF2127 domain-containing protein n=1 Tax=Nitrospira moscoviensis TaxID=42253 RepID=A0A0K2G6L1_NITMO|nr:hypothetical protein [Nitrospira moscoviensis]ALA56583.1 conserved membrane protein of unknown function [Nitrospira moscoviensis]
MDTRPIGVDIKLMGGLFLIVGAVDLVVIVLFPSYALKLFGTIVTGPLAFLVKLHSPAVHLLIGYGFLWLCPWAWGLSLAYAGFGLVSEALNQFTFGFHPVRSGFMATTALFIIYLYWRRQLFTDQPVLPTTGPSVSEGSP